MPRGAYTAKQDRKEKHIEDSYEKRGVSHQGGRAARLGDREQAGQGRQERWIGPVDQPQRSREEGLGDPPPARKNLGPALQDFDRSLERP